MVPGPSNLHPRVYQALLTPMVSHKDPAFLAAMDETAELLRMVFQTRNASTFCLPATGGSGMESSLLNLLEPGDTVVIGHAGFFAHRMVEIAQRLGVKLVTVEVEWGQAIDTARLIAAVREHGARVLAMVHGETSTGVEQPLDGLGAACRELDCYLVVDAVPTLGGTSLPVDELQIDICYSGSQKCLSAPPGLSPITISQRAMRRIETRRTPVGSWYLDLSLHAHYWDETHIYHHTGPVLSIYALREALRLIAEEGLSARFDRHRLHSRALTAGLRALGLKLFAEADHRLATVVTVVVPEGIDSARARAVLLDEFDVEIAGGLDVQTNRMWRIGIMGHSATRANVLLTLGGLELALNRQGYGGSGALAAADAVYAGV
ncbi:MAG: alanine--glyoxylate aminotransferase family protein [Chloroflexi bacterium]|nr:alanine--glyoxylate aminotransferase family protein [Chloroflexota bacterium]